MLENESEIDRVCETLKSVLNSCGIDVNHRILIAEEDRVAATVMNGKLLNDAIVTKFKAKVKIDYDKLIIQFT